SLQLPSSHEILYELGVTYELTGRIERARQSYGSCLKLIESKIQKNKTSGSHYADQSLALARLRQRDKAVMSARRAFQVDSTNNEVVLIKIARMYAILGSKDLMLEWYRKAKEKNPEYDLAYLATALDFEKYRKDPDLLLIARER